MGRELRYAVASKVQLRNSLAAALQREHNVQGDKKEKNRLSFQTLRSRTGCHPTYDWSVCCAENNVAAARKQQKKKHGMAMSNEGKRKGKKEAMAVRRNRDESSSQRLSKRFSVITHKSGGTSGGSNADSKSRHHDCARPRISSSIWHHYAPPNLPFVPDSEKSHHFRPFLASFVKNITLIVQCSARLSGCCFGAFTYKLACLVSCCAAMLVWSNDARANKSNNCDNKM